MAQPHFDPFHQLIKHMLVRSGSHWVNVARKMVTWDLLSRLVQLTQTRH